jgi:TonB family protein
MRGRDLSLTIALCASLLAHGLLALITFEGARLQMATIRLPGFPRENPDVVEVDPPDTANLGGAANDGFSPNSSPGKETIRAKDAPSDQALLSRDPQGPGRIGDLPSFSLVPQTDETAAASSSSTPLVVLRRSEPVLPVPTDVPQPFGAGPDVRVMLVPRVRPAHARSPQSQQQPEQQQQQQSPIAKSNQRAADPAVMSPSESDAFSTLGGIEFRDGRIDSRLGRAFKSVRPQLGLAAQIDLMGLTDPRIVLKLRIDATGKVVAVDVVHSTGSDSIDQPVKLVMYQWWFEPQKGPTGQAMAETIVFPISWH